MYPYLFRLFSSKRRVLRTGSTNLDYLVQRVEYYVQAVHNLQRRSWDIFTVGKIKQEYIITCGSLYSNQLDTWGRRGSDLWDVGNLDLVTLICRPRSADLDLLITKDIAPGY